MTLLHAIASVWLLVFVSPLLVRACGRHAGWPLAAGLLIVLGIIIGVRSGGDIREAVSWIPAIEVAFRLRLDGLSFLFSIVVLAVGAVVLAYSSSYLRGQRSTGFYMLMAAFAAAMLTLVLADALVVLFVA